MLQWVRVIAIIIVLKLVSLGVCDTEQHLKVDKLMDAGRPEAAMLVWFPVLLPRIRAESVSQTYSWF